MHTGNLQAAAGRIQEALEQLQHAWNRTSEEWRDENSRRIQEEHLAPLAHELMGVLPAIGQMTQTIQQAVRDCSES